MAAFALSAASCQSTSLLSEGPSDTLNSYAQALREGRADDAYQMLSTEAKAQISLTAFRRALSENPDEAQEIARALTRPESSPLVRARVLLPNGDELLLTFENGAFRVDASAIDLYSQATPRRALQSFVRAYDRKRYDVILRLVPEAELGKSSEADTSLTTEVLRREWEGAKKEEMDRTVLGIKAALPTAAIEETGDTASMSYGALGTLLLIREHGTWKIKDF